MVDKFIEVATIVKQIGARIIPFDQPGEYFYRKAVRSFDKYDYIGALIYMHRALKKDPDNLEYRLNLAEIYTEMSCFERSNQILFELINKDGGVSDCYYAIGCNFLGLEDYPLARDSLYTYAQMEPDGYYMEDVSYMLESIEDYEDDDEQRPEHVANAEKGHQALERGDYAEAIRFFELACASENAELSSKNALALSYFLCDRDEQAIALCEEILSADPDDLNANCNMALFLSEIGLKEKAAQHVKRACGAFSGDVDDALKLAVATCEAQMHAEATQHLETLCNMNPFDTKFLHMHAVNMYNLGQYDKALALWTKILSIDPSCGVAGYYAKITRRVINDEEKKYDTLHYDYQLPHDELRRQIGLIKQMSQLDPERLRREYEENRALVRALNWAAGFADDDIKGLALRMMIHIKKDETLSRVRAFLLSKNESDEIKKELFVQLKLARVKEPYFSYIGGSIVQVHLTMHRSLNSTSRSYEAVVQETLKRMSSDYGYSAFLQVLAIWSAYIASLGENIPKITRPALWSYALEIAYLRLSGQDVNYEAMEKLSLHKAASLKKCSDRLLLAYEQRATEESGDGSDGQDS